MPDTNFADKLIEEFGRRLHIDTSIFDHNFTRLQSKNAIADFEKFECTNIQTMSSDWVTIQKKSTEVKENRLKEERTFLQKFASGEFLAHHLAYQDLCSKKTIKVLEADGSYREYTPQQIETTHNGLVGYILVPTTAETDTTLELKVLFRGTASLTAVGRDLFEFGGAGSESFTENSALILSQINKIVAQHQKPTNITLAGHSLGSSDAQNCMAALMEAVAESHHIIEPTKVTDNNMSSGSPKTDFNKIQHLKLFGCNSPGIAEETNVRAKALAKMCHEKNVPLTLECNYLRMHHDAVQQTGETTLLSDAPVEHAKVEVIKASSLEKYSYLDLAKRTSMVGAAAASAVFAAPMLLLGITTGLALGATTVGLINTADAHTQHLFNPNAPAHFSYERFSNQNPSERHRTQATKSSFLNTMHNGLLSVMNKLKSMHSAVSGVFNPAPQKPPVLFSTKAQMANNGISLDVGKAEVETPANQKPWWHLF